MMIGEFPVCRSVLKKKDRADPKVADYQILRDWDLKKLGKLEASYC
jgi:hypothetical protein